MPEVFPNNIGVQASFFTKNPCVTNPIYRTKTKLMLHSTATPGAPAQNFIPNWDSKSAGACVEFILDDEKILQFVQVGKNGKNCLKTWHCGGSANNDYIATEVCEPIEAQLIPINYKEQSMKCTYPRKYSVKRIQMELQYLGFYSGGIDGSFGPGTDAAVRAFQKSAGIAVDGCVGPTTLRKLAARNGSYCAYDVAGATPFFNKAYDNAVSLFGELCKYVGAKPSEILCHQEGYRAGIAGNHADVEHWFPLHNKPMSEFRKDVQAYLDGTYRFLSKEEDPFAKQFTDAVTKVAESGIINSPQYWYDIDDNEAVNNTYVMSLLRQSATYFSSRLYANSAAQMMADNVTDINLNKETYSFKEVTTLVNDVMHFLYGSISKTYTYTEGINDLVRLGIINSPNYWLGLSEEKAPTTPNFKALVQKTATYLCSQSYQLAVDAIKLPIGMNSVNYWKSGNYTYKNVMYFFIAIAGAL